MSSRTFTFDLNLLSNNPTDPFFTIDYGDKSPIELPKLIQGLAVNLTHIYENSGVFNVVITVFNKVSSSTFNLTVLKILFSAFLN